jgi:hypothetical protein
MLILLFLLFPQGQRVCSWAGRLFGLSGWSIIVAFYTVIFGLATSWFVRIVCACWILAFQGASAKAVIRMMLLIRSGNCKSYLDGQLMSAIDGYLTHKCWTYDHGIRLSIHIQFCHLKFR